MLKGLKELVRDQRFLRSGALRAAAMVRSLARAEPGLLVLCYHHVALAARANFSEQIGFLKRFGPFLDADVAAERVAAGQCGDGPSFLLTFDDGYADNLDVALPVILAHGVPAIQFLVSDWIDAAPGGRDRRTGHMDRRDVQRWLEAGLDIGSHSASHRRLSGLDAGSIALELDRSRDHLSALAGKPIHHFACPWGVANADFDPLRDPALAEASGYRTFFTTRRGRARTAADLMSMPRHVLEPEWGLYQLEALLGGPRFARA